MLRIEANSQEMQEAIGSALAAVCPARCILFLQGDLGAGKTTLVRGFLRGLGYKGPVKSPTYTLMEPYELADRQCFHFDLYRLADPGELEYLGLRDLLESDATLLFEWPERGGAGELPQADIEILIGYHPQGRTLQMKGCTHLGRAMLDALHTNQSINSQSVHQTTPPNA